jgi:hypothetical protein
MYVNFMQPESKPHTKQPPASKLRDPNTVAAALLGLKSQAKAGKLNPEHAGYAAAVGETIRIVLTFELAESDRSAELVLIMGCFRSDPKLPPSMQKMIESYIDRVNKLCFDSKGNDSKLVTEWLTKMHT